jgi:hypothetical protein
MPIRPVLFLVLATSVLGALAAGAEKEKLPEASVYIEADGVHYSFPPSYRPSPKVGHPTVVFYLDRQPVRYKVCFAVRGATDEQWERLKTGE